MSEYSESEQMTLAPIVLFTYNRPIHTEKTLNTLKRNTLASQSTLYIYCDGPRENISSEEKENIARVREIAKRELWCKDVCVIESEKNKGLAGSIREGVTEIVQKHGKVIVLEDDLLTSPAFLTYMNKALNKYDSRKTVFSISGYNLPKSKMEIPADYDYDVYVSLRNGSWGWATWEDRWKQVDWTVRSFERILNTSQLREAFNRAGDDVFPMLEAQQAGMLNIWSIQFTVAHFENHAVSIVPTMSYVNNIGLDGTGENCHPTRAMENETLCEKEDIKFLDILYEDKRIINAFYNANCIQKRPVWKKIVNRISRGFGGKSVFVIKKKVYD